MSDQAFYSVIQYAESPERGEFVNVGVVIFAGRPPVMVRVNESLRRVHKVFGPAAGGDLKIQLKAIASRLYSSFSGSLDREIIDKFIVMRTGKIRLSPARALVTDEPKITLDMLFARLVDDKVAKPRRERVNRELSRQFELNGVASLLDKPAPVELPQNVILKADYGFQNSAYHYIKAVSLRDDAETALHVAGKQAFVGRWLRTASTPDHEQNLIVVADARGQNHSFIRGVNDLLIENGVSFYTMDRVNELSDEIRKHTNEPNRLLF
jgi:hypothetical protein